MGQGLVTGDLTREGVRWGLCNGRLSVSMTERALFRNRNSCWRVNCLAISREDASVVLRELGGLRHEGTVSGPLKLTHPFLEIVKPAEFKPAD